MTKSGFRYALSMLIVVAAFLVPRMARAGCEKDTDCKGDRICNAAGRCVAPDAPPSSASTSAPAIQRADGEGQPYGQEQQRNSKPMMVAGIVLASTGGAAIVLSITLIAIGVSKDYSVPETRYDSVNDSYSYYDQDHDCNDPEDGFNHGDCTALGVGLVMLPIGVAIAIPGLILAPIGARREATAAVAVEPLVTPQMLGVRGRF